MSMKNIWIGPHFLLVVVSYPCGRPVLEAMCSKKSRFSLNYIKLVEAAFELPKLLHELLLHLHLPAQLPFVLLPLRSGVLVILVRQVGIFLSYHAVVLSLDVSDLDLPLFVIFGDVTIGVDSFQQFSFVFFKLGQQWFLVSYFCVQDERRAANQRFELLLHWATRANRRLIIG